MALKAQRKPVRDALFQAAEDLVSELTKEVPTRLQVKLLYERMNRHNTKLLQLDERIMDQMTEAGATEDEFKAEYDSVTTFQNVFVEACERASSILTEDEDERKTEVTCVSTGSRQRKNKFRLPKLELRKFDGDCKEWIAFWSQFKGIHEDEQLSEEEKFQYLIQSTKENSAARTVVTSFPPSKDNYPKAVEYLRERFGREEILVEVYVRELLIMVINNSQKKNVSLSNIYDKLETQLRALETLGVTSDKYASMLYPMVESSLPEYTLRTWERSRATMAHKGDLLAALMVFIRTEVDGEERIKMAKKGFSCEKKQGKEMAPENVPTAKDLFHGDQKGNSDCCIFCEKLHKSVDCFKLSGMTLEEKIRTIKEKNACFVCLRRGHISRKCKTKTKCPVCEKRHLVVLCPDLDGMKRKDPPMVKSEEASTTSMSNFGKGQILLQTIQVMLKSKGNKKMVRAILDSGCQHSYITAEVAKALKLKPVDQIIMGHTLFGGQETQKIKHPIYHVEVNSADNSNKLGMKFLEQGVICSSVEGVPSGPWLDELQEKSNDLSDIGSRDGGIQVLFGADVIGCLYTGKIFKTEAGPVALETIFGWTLTGVLRREGYITSAADLLSISLLSNQVSMDNLWKLELLGIRDPVEVQSREKMIQAAVQKFQESVCINEEGRYEVALPWIDGHVSVADNYELAKKRLTSVVKRLNSTDKLELYGGIFKEWLDLGIIEEVPLEECDTQHVSYMPHRPNFNPNSSTTPVRPVFDASAKSKGSPSLNECLHKGPNLIELIPAIITRFRMKKIGITSDIKKAFLQISIRKEERDFLRFLWLEESTGKVKTFRHCRVVFGVSSSPFLLGATLNHHLSQVAEERKVIAETLQKSLYVDNCIASLDSLEEAMDFRDEAKLVMNAGKFELRGWTWNGDDSKDSVMSILGVLWDKRVDTLQLDLDNLSEETETVTLRSVMSAAQRVFDPMGMCSPVTLIPKLIIQKLWQLKLGMDDEAPEELKQQFWKWMEEVSVLKRMNIPRWVVEGPLEQCKLSVHGFSDGSSCAYAGCVYLRSEYAGNVTVRLLVSKARVAPEKATIPRLELLGCVILARLVNGITTYMDIGEVETFLWTDSANALYWINNEDNWGVFIYNRVKDILKLTRKEDWRHLPGADNPADLPSRGCLASSFVEKHWWEGPEWLKQERRSWPVSTVSCQMDEVIAEKKKSPVINMVAQEKTCFFYNFSNFSKLVRVVAWILRACRRGNGGSRESLKLSLVELEHAELVIWKNIQKDNLKDVKLFKQMHAKKDEMGLRRVRSKIRMRKDTVDFRFPILLPSQNPVVKSMIMREHLNNHHAGINTLMCLLREKYWIIQTRRNVRGVIHQCQRCRKLSVKAVEPEEPPLPVERVRDAEIFEIVGIDLGGPLFLQRSRKVWFVVFSCGVYRALHLELVSSLSTESLTKSIRRFKARRGRPWVIYSDNGTNFVGLENLMKEINWRELAEKTGVMRIEWRFNAPAAPWWEGWYERIVGMVKKLLRRNLGKATLCFEDLETLLFEIEAIINSPPLTYMSEDPEDPIPLSPALLMGLKKPIGVADLNNLDGSAFRKKHGEMEKLRKDLQKRFRSEYLGALVHRDNFKKTMEVKIGDIVIVEIENMSRINWPLGRVVDVVRGRDGAVRKVDVKTQHTTLTRPVQKVRLMEVKD